jgi:hypothetical protein
MHLVDIGKRQLKLKSMEGSHLGLAIFGLIWYAFPRSFTIRELIRNFVAFVHQFFMRTFYHVEFANRYTSCVVAYVQGKLKVHQVLVKELLTRLEKRHSNSCSFSSRSDCCIVHLSLFILLIIHDEASKCLFRV